ncbi:MAG: transglycosylase [Brevundimonas sp.]|uniref:hypothetical protein n=1 Tax=Brevundimonas sp. Leaf363 TaxID=1736353 RepID=UPI000701FBF6|nr:hypothetical protein [Brevundimonas sp. Leaf363]KQS56234.1 transglycosylase [Brevundimonas sp. Leaf363]RZJ93760.1 MAG: transglycosylase [Brevundimonas sp.]
MQYADVVMAVLGAALLAWIADLVTGRRGFFATSLVSTTGAICGWFLCIRVFAAETMDQWGWVLWAMAGSAIGLVAYFLFRNKR